MMALFVLGIGVLVAGGVASALAGASPRGAAGLGTGSAAVGSCFGLAAALAVLVSGAPVAWNVPWAVPGGAFHVEIDPLSAFFLLPVFTLGPLAAVFGGEYLRGHGDGGSGTSWLFYNGLVASMAMVVVARNAVLFLSAWEVMAITSFFLVTLGDRETSVRGAGWTYLVATHLATAFLFAMFALLARDSGSLDFDRFRDAGAGPGTAGVVFVLAVVGFGTKAGLIPFHVWLPEAHPAAPSHVSAVMSGVMVNMGIYGIILTRTWAGRPAMWWGWLLLAVGAASALLGALLALSQTDVKRALAYSTVENMGIVALALGLGVLAECLDRTGPALLAYGGALVHLLNHAVFKALLFLGAGSMIRASGTGEMSRLGGLLRRMPRTGVAVLVGASAAAGVPALNGFVGEFLILLAAIGTLGSVSALTVIACLALVGALAAFGFVRVFGIAFLGEPRSDGAERAREMPAAMTVPLGALAVGCAVLGLSFPGVYGAASRAVAGALGLAGGGAGALPDLLPLQIACGVFAGLTAATALARRGWIARRPMATAPTWGCGFARPTPRMQYTASSFGQPMVSLFGPILGIKVSTRSPQGPFPREASFTVSSPDPLRDALYAPLFGAGTRTLARLRGFQQGRVQVYVLYIALTLVALLVWSVGWPR